MIFAREQFLDSTQNSNFTKRVFQDDNFGKIRGR